MFLSIYNIYLIIANTLQSILLISHCATLSFYFSVVFALLLPHLAVTLLPTIPLPFFALLLPIIPHLTVTIPPTIHLPFWLFFSPSSLCLNLPLLFFQSFPSLFGYFSPHYSTPNITIPPTLPLPLWLFFSPSFFLYTWYYFLYTPLFHSVHVRLQKKVITLLSFNGFFFSKLFLATLLLFLIALLWVDAIWYFGIVFLNSLTTCSFSPSYGFV